jgi:hypothetical protein
MPNTFDDNYPAFQMELHAIIPGPHPVSSGKFPRQRLRATYVRPIAKPFDELDHSRLYRPRKFRNSSRADTETRGSIFVQIDAY